MRLLQIFVDNIVPIMLIAGGGVWLRRGFDVSPKPISTTMFYLLSPVLVFYSLYTSVVDGGEFFSLYFATLLFQVLMALIAYVIMRLQGSGSLERAGVMVASFCLNAGNYGLSLVFFAFGEEALSRAVIVFLANVTINYSLGVYVASNGRASPRKALMNISRVPAMYALVIAFVFVGLDITLPVAIERGVSRLSDAAIPMMLLLLGLQLGKIGKLGQLRLLVTGVGLKLFFAPLLAVGLAVLFNLSDLSATAFIMQASMPTAILTIVLATEFDMDHDLSLNLIMISTFLSPITLSILIYILQETLMAGL